LLAAIFCYFGFAAYGVLVVPAVGGGDCDQYYVTCLVLFVLVMVACKLYTPVFLVAGNMWGATVLCAIIFALSFALSVTFGVFWNVNQCLKGVAADYYGYGATAFASILLFTIWTCVALLNQLVWHYKGLRGPNAVIASPMTYTLTGDGGLLRKSLLKK
jgi:hypothetical protein